MDNTQQQSRQGFLQKLWNWLNGNKTIFGTVLLTNAQFIPADFTMIGLFHVQSAMLWLGGILTGAGVAHKLAKATTDPGPNQ